MFCVSVISIRKMIQIMVQMYNKSSIFRKEKKRIYIYICILSSEWPKTALFKGKGSDPFLGDLKDLAIMLVYCKS